MKKYIATLDNNIAGIISLETPGIDVIFGHINIFDDFDGAVKYISAAITKRLNEVEDKDVINSLKEQLYDITGVEI